MCHIRQKLDLRPDQGAYIKNIPAVGYTLTRTALQGTSAVAA